MKIGLLTYHVSVNIGAMMQTYATCRALTELGHEVVIVDIRQPEQQRRGVNGLLTDIVYARQRHNHQFFRDNYYPSLTRRYYSLEELRKKPPEVDCFVVGSDQTWNPAISKDVAMAYFLDFGNNNIKRFSYASSFGMERWELPKSMTDSVYAALHRMCDISVREKTAVSICKDTFDIDAQLVVDPTLLFKNYDEITGKISPNEELLCYKLLRNQDFFENIGTIKKQLNISARLLNNSFPVSGLRYTYPPSVKEWIRRIGGAKYVLTDSFHGVAFSLIYQRQFVVIRNHNGRDSRFEDLLSEVGLTDRIFDSVEQVSKTDIWKKQIDYSIVEKKMELLRRSSWSYLERALQ